MLPVMSPGCECRCHASIHVDDAADVMQKMKVMFYKIDVVCARACIIPLRFNPEPLWRKLPRNIRNPTCDKTRSLQEHDLHLPAICFGTCIKMPSPAKLQLSDCPECR